MGTTSTARLSAKLEKCEKVLATYIGQCAPVQFAQAYGASGVDMAIIDMEHGPFNPENVGDFAVACNAANFPVIARIQDCEYHCISKCIDQGCDGILVPRTETLEQVELAIASMRFHPVGRKGVGGRACLRGDSVDEFNKKRLIFIQIESPKGADMLDEILTKYGHEIAGIIIGPSDMSIMCGCPLVYDDERILACIHKTVAVAGAHGKSVGMFMNDLAEAKTWYGRGMNIFWTAPETYCMQVGLSALAAGVAAFDDEGTEAAAGGASIYG